MASKYQSIIEDPIFARLSAMQKDFVLAYLENPNNNGAEAARQAGYSPNRARIAASTLLHKNQDVRDLLLKFGEEIPQISEGKIAGIEEVLTFLTETMRNTLKLRPGSSEYAEVGIRERVQAAEALGKKYGLFTTNVKLDTPISITVVEQYGTGNSPAES
jgi:phage terminase small subunit